MNHQKPPIRKKKKWTWNFSKAKTVPPSNVAPTTTATPQPIAATSLPTKLRKTNLAMLKSNAWGNKRYNGVAYSARIQGIKQMNCRLFDNLENVILDCLSLQDGIETNLCCKFCAEEVR